MKIRDPADHRSACDEMVAARERSCHQLRITRVAMDEPVARMAVERTHHVPVLRLVVDADDLVAALEQFLHNVPADEPGRSGDQDPGHDPPPRR